jgi:hypothetical protein
VGGLASGTVLGLLSAHINTNDDNSGANLDNHNISSGKKPRTKTPGARRDAEDDDKENNNPSAGLPREGGSFVSFDEFRRHREHHRATSQACEGTREAGGAPDDEDEDEAAFWFGGGSGGDGDGGGGGGEGTFLTELDQAGGAEDASTGAAAAADKREARAAALLEWRAARDLWERSGGGTSAGVVGARGDAGGRASASALAAALDAMLAHVGAPRSLSPAAAPDSSSSPSSSSIVTDSSNEAVAAAAANAAAAAAAAAAKAAAALRRGGGAAGVKAAAMLEARWLTGAPHVHLSDRLAPELAVWDLAFREAQRWGCTSSSQLTHI